MEIYHHPAHAHLNGLIIGTIIGAFSVSAITALVVVIVKPDLLTHPTSFTSVISTQTPSQTPSSGIAVQNSMQAGTGNLMGPAGRLEE